MSLESTPNEIGVAAGANAPAPTLFRTPQAAEYLQMSVAFLKADRRNKRTIPFVQLGPRAIVYRKSDLEEFVAARVKKGSATDGIE
jgi:hypothetical protein